MECCFPGKCRETFVAPRFLVEPNLPRFPGSPWVCPPSSCRSCCELRRPSGTSPRKWPPCAGPSDGVGRQLVAGQSFLLVPIPRFVELRNGGSLGTRHLVATLANVIPLAEINMSCLPLLVLKGMCHLWKYIVISSRGLNKMEVSRFVEL